MKRSERHANSKQPSIFTPRQQRLPTPSEPPRPSAARTVRTSSPFRRPTSPGHKEPVTLDFAAAELGKINTGSDSKTAVKGDPPLLGNPGYIAQQAPSIWASILPEPRNGSQRGIHKGRTASLAASPTPHLLDTPTGEFPPPFNTPASSTRKRAFEPTPIAAPTSEPAPKRPRIKPRIKYNLDGLAFPPKPAGFAPALEPPSPLFFSRSPRPRPRPRLPPRFSSAEAAARMLSKARAEESRVKTVSLARGTIATASSFGTPGAGASPHSSSQSAHRRSVDRSSATGSQSPEALGNGAKDIGTNASQHLNSIGILELLEQDERPTFIVDLSDGANYGPGKLLPLFSNSSVKSYEGLLDLITGTSSEATSPGSQTYLQFKSWLLSASVNGESLNVCLPAFSFANMMWTCSTLRKRLRIISGAFPTLATGQRPPRPSSNSTSTLVEPPREQMDYFGAATAAQYAVSSDPASTGNEAVQSIEHSKTTIGDAVANGAVLTPGAREATDSLDLLPSPAAATYVPPPSEAPLLTAESAVTNINWFSSHIPVAPTADLPCFDWTRLPVTDNMPRHIQFARSIDWASTSLGPIECWSSDLRQMCNLIMASPHPAAMYWGEDLIAIYNEAYILLAGQKHPDLMGQSYRVAWKEIWDEVKDVFANAKVTGEATMKDDDCLFMRRSDYLEETYFSWSIIPMVGGDGTVMGLYNPAFEKTRRKIAERRMLTLREIGERTASARDVKGFWTQVQGAFEYNEMDSPFLLLYSVVDDSDSDSSSVYSTSMFGTRQCLLEGVLGVPEGHPCAPEQIDLRNGMEGLGPIFREVMKSDRAALLDVGNKDLPEHLLQGLDWRGFGDPCRSIVVCPIHPTTEKENVLGFLVLGVNPRRPYDDDYSLFVQLLSRQLATSLASVVLFEEEIRRGQKAAKLAALDRIELSEQLAQRTQEAKESETKFTRMAEFAPVGMFIAGPDGKIIFANDTWYAITRVPKKQDAADQWIDLVKPEDRELVEKMWDTLVIDAKSVSNEFRFKAQWQARSGDRGDTWVLFSAYPEKYEDGKLKSVFGSITNISQQKWAEDVQRRRVEEAVELKRQQENFIDITSHEMRNPLSAILQCSDEISTSMTKFRSTGKQEIPDELIANCLDAAQTISLCSQHQKRIVDDILTLSKLDSALLLVTPVDAQPLTVVQRALKMHEGELQAADIQMKFVVDQSFRDMRLDWVRFDPSRVLQVLINLTTNAIKFTTTESKRTITVTISAYKQRPSEFPDAPVNYFPTRSRKKDAMEDRDWGDGEKVYIHFSVRDTGRGLSPEEKKMLFLRFSQASPRTHVQYGGSGLGLFISRELTELQGGEIGVESEAGKGSTFAFYVAARRTAAPVEDDGAGIARRAASDSKGKKEPLAMASKADKNGKTVAPVAESPAAKPPPVPVQKKVLIVEDNLVNQRVLQKQLKNLGTEVHLANHGGEALEKLMQSTYMDAGGTLELGVVLMDQEMPVMDGLTCTRKIREMEREGKIKVHVPIIAVTANARQEQIQTALDAGMDDVVSKPFRIPDLVPKIEELMQRFPMPDFDQSSGVTAGAASPSSTK